LPSALLSEAEASEVLDYITIMKSMNGETDVRRFFDDALLKMLYGLSGTSAERRPSSTMKRKP
jgi:hypothetical protein